jgi:hypothetical protein
LAPKQRRATGHVRPAALDATIGPVDQTCAGSRQVVTAVALAVHGGLQ